MSPGRGGRLRPARHDAARRLAERLPRQPPANPSRARMFTSRQGQLVNDVKNLVEPLRIKDILDLTVQVRDG